jgi:pimeloyl-ACP methyl ester carboxylesterase
MRAFSPPTIPLVLLHGAGGDARVWAAQTDWLSRRGWITLALEFPAHGGTASPPLPSIERMADWVWSQLDARQTGPVVLAGHSMGSLVALHAAGQRPGQVRGLALLGTALPMRVSKRLLAQAENAPAEAIDNVVRWSYAQDDPLTPTPGFQSPQFYRALLQQQQTHWAEGSVLASDLQACDRYDSGEAAARQWSGPTLFLLGAHDRMTPPANADGLRDALVGNRTVLLDCGHNLMAEAPHAVAHALSDWMERDLFAAG